MNNIHNIETLEWLREKVLVPDTPYYDAVTAGIQALKQVDNLWVPLNDETLKEIKDCEYYLVDWDNECELDFRIDCPIIAQARYMHFPEYAHRNGEISPEGWYWVFECFPIRTNQVWGQVYGDKEFLIKRFIPLNKKKRG